MGSKFCCICYSSTPHQVSAWVTPCRCRDPRAAFHHHCLLALVQKKEAYGDNLGRNFYCRYCRVRFKILPDMGPLVGLLEAIDRCWYRKFCEVVIHILMVVFVEVTTTTFGLTVLCDVYGRKAACDMVLAMDPLIAVSICQVIPYACILINSLPWEDRLLYLLRRCSNIPIIGRVLPLEDKNIKIPASRNASLVGASIGGLLLPIYSRVIGDFIFFTETSHLKRFILGGAVFLLLKGFLSAYYKQKNYVRESNMTIMNYSERTTDNAI